MSDSLVAGLTSRFQEIEGRLEAAQDAATREEVKREIIALFKRVDGALTELGQLKDGRLLGVEVKGPTGRCAPPMINAAEGYILLCGPSGPSSG